MWRTLKLVQNYGNDLLFFESVVNPVNNHLKIISFSTYKNTTDESQEQKKKKKKTPRIPKITLLHPDDTMTVCLLQDAEKIAKKQNLLLMKMPQADTKTDRNIYKLFSGTQYDAICSEDDDTLDSVTTSKGGDDYKSTKLFMIQGKITDHDLDIKINNINKVLSKKHMVKIVLNYTSAEDQTILKNAMKKINGIVQQEKFKDNNAVLLYVPELDNENIEGAKKITQQK